MPNFFTTPGSAMINLSLLTLLAAMAVGLPSPVAAQMPDHDADKSHDTSQDTPQDKTDLSLDELSQQLVNPAGHNWVLNSYVSVTKKKGAVTSATDTASKWLLQPVLPIMLNKETGLTLMNRPTLPYVFKAPMPRLDEAGDISGIESFSGIGDLSFQTALGKTQPSGFGHLMWGIGVNLVFPTAGKDQIGTGKYSVGPAGMLVAITEDYTFGAVANQIWSYAGDSDRKSVNQGQIQLLYFKQMGNGWQIGDNPTWTAKWKAGSGNKYDLPIGLGIYKTMRVGGNAWRFGVTPRYFLKSYESWGNRWELNISITPVLNNPFM